MRSRSGLLYPPLPSPHPPKLQRLGEALSRLLLPSPLCQEERARLPMSLSVYFFPPFLTTEPDLTRLFMPPVPPSCLPPPLPTTPHLWQYTGGMWEAVAAVTHIWVPNISVPHHSWKIATTPSDPARHYFSLTWHQSHNKLTSFLNCLEIPAFWNAGYVLMNCRHVSNC